jgi:predicted DNA repair protein MutK
MASGFFVLLDDIAAIMDDVAVMSKIAAKKTAGILGDDLAVNAEKASGFASSRELPVLWAISKGSLLNKIIILPIAFLLSAFLPVAIIVILVLGGLFLAYEGAEKVYEFIVPHKHEESEGITEEVLTEEQILAVEKTKIKSAIITDFILSVEIVIIALGTVIEEPLTQQIIVTSIIALIATIGVYGIVALIVRMDEAGYKLIKFSKSEKSISAWIGNVLVKALPLVIKGLTIIGTIALLLVAGGIFVHYIPYFHHLSEEIKMPAIIKEFVVGLVLGFAVLLVINLFKKVFKKKTV